MAVLLSDEYRQEAEALRNDPILIGMAKGLTGVTREDIAHEDGTPRFEFMLAARDEYRSRGGKHQMSMGGAANALLALKGWG